MFFFFFFFLNKGYAVMLIWCKNAYMITFDRSYICGVSFSFFLFFCTGTDKRIGKSKN
jgi:hypothetical protein